MLDCTDMPVSYWAQVLLDGLGEKKCRELVDLLNQTLPKAKKEPATVLTCPKCGRKYTQLWRNRVRPVWRRVCSHCHFIGYEANSQSKTLKTWNQAVEDYIGKTYKYQDSTDWIKC